MIDNIEIIYQEANVAQGKKKTRKTEAEGQKDEQKDEQQGQPQTQPNEGQEGEQEPQKDESPSPPQEDQQGEDPQKDESPSPPQPATPEQEHAARALHNERTGGGEIHEGELEEQREEHNRRTAGVAT